MKLGILRFAEVNLTMPRGLLLCRIGCRAWIGRWRTENL